VCKLTDLRLFLPAAETIVASAWNFSKQSVLRLCREPLVHFFLLGALLFALQRISRGDPRVIIVTPGLQADLARRFQDLQGKKPSPTELAEELHKWERDEALFREALRRHLERDDPAVRSVLVEKMRVLASLDVPERSPSEAELEGWLASHRSKYETPLRYDFDFVQFPKSDRSARSELEQFERALRDGASLASLGRPVMGANLSVADMQGRIAPELAQRIPSLAPGTWQTVETEQELLLARVKQISGGMPSLETLRPRLVADASFAARQAAVERVLQRTIDRYHIEERR
jgi:hypothetical protein